MRFRISPRKKRGVVLCWRDRFHAEVTKAMQAPAVIGTAVALDAIETLPVQRAIEKLERLCSVAVDQEEVAIYRDAIQQLRDMRS
jgi:hypothetical protein